MVTFYSSKTAKGDNLKDRAIPNFEVIAHLHNGLRIIRNGIDKFVYALIDGDENLMIPYVSGEITQLEHTIYFSVTNSSQVGIFDGCGNEIIPIKYSAIQLIGNFFLVSIATHSSDHGIYGLISQNGKVIFPVENVSIENITPDIFLIKKHENENNSSMIKCFLWFSKEDKTVDIPDGEIELINNGQVLCVRSEYYDTILCCNISKDVLLNCNGLLISPENTVSIGQFNNEGFAQISVNSLSSRNNWIDRYWYGLIDWNGHLYCENDSEPIPMPDCFDWVSRFNNGIADTYKGNILGHINYSLQKIVKVNLYGNIEYIVLPSKYSYGIDSECEYIIVAIDDLFGVLRSDGVEVIPPAYSFVEIIYDSTINFYCFLCYIDKVIHIYDNSKLRETNGHADIFNDLGEKLNTLPIKDPYYLGNGFFRCGCEVEKIKLRKSNYLGEYESLRYQIIDSKCKLISELKFSKVFKYKEDSLYAIFQQGDSYGALNTLGEIVLYGIEQALTVEDIPSLILREKNSPILYNMENFKVPFEHNYSSIKYVGDGLFHVSLRKGILSKDYDWEATTYVDIFNRAIAPMTGRVSEIKSGLFVSSIWGNDISLHAVINVFGVIIIPYCKYRFEIHQNFIIGWDEDYDPIIFSLNGSIIANKGIYSNGYRFEDFSDRFIKIRWCNNDTVYLMDIHGTIVYDNYNYYDFEQIIPGVIKIKAHRGDGSRSYLGDYNGNILTKGYDEIEVHKNGLCIVSDQHKTGIGYGRYETYDKYDTFYGVINITGEEVLPVKYKSVEIFEEENIIKTEVGHMTYDGRFIVYFDSPDGLTQLILDKEYDYCLPFVNDLAIVYAGERCGIIDISKNVIFPTICLEIIAVADDVYKFKLNGLWGLFKVNEGIIIPNKYSDIQEFKNGFARVTFSPTTSNIHYYGLITLEREIIRPICSGLQILSDSIIAYAKEGIESNPISWVLLDIKNNRRLNLDKRITYVGNLSENLVRICVNKFPCLRLQTALLSDGKWGYMNKTGEVIVQPIYDKCLDFIGHLGPVKLGDKWGFINNKGEVIVPFEYDNVEKRYEEYVGIKHYTYEKDNQYFCFDNNGNITHQGDCYSEPEYENYNSVYDNPNYDDNLDLDQQSIDFWNSL